MGGGGVVGGQEGEEERRGWSIVEREEEEVEGGNFLGKGEPDSVARGSEWEEKKKRCAPGEGNRGKGGGGGGFQGWVRGVGLRVGWGEGGGWGGGKRTGELGTFQTVSEARLYPFGRVTQRIG